MGKSRLVYVDWIVELGRDPERQLPEQDGPEISIADLSEEELRTRAIGRADPRLEILQAEVREAVASLPELERELIERVHFLGESISDLAERSGRKLHRLEAALLRAKRKLAILLSQYEPKVNDAVNSPELRTISSCPVCQSPNRLAIELLIRAKPVDATWKLIMRKLRDQFGLNLKVPQRLISHEKYHMTPNQIQKEGSDVKG